MSLQELQEKAAEVGPLQEMTKMILDGRRAEWNEELILFEMAWPWRDLGTSILDQEVSGLLNELTTQGRTSFLTLYTEILSYANTTFDDAKGKWDLPMYLENEKQVDVVITKEWVKSEAVFYEHVEKIKDKLQLTQGQIDYMAGLALARREGHKRQLAELKTSVKTLGDALGSIFVSNSPEDWKKFSEAAEAFKKQYDESEYAIEKSNYPDLEHMITLFATSAIPVGELMSPEAVANWKAVAPKTEKKPRKKKAKAEENPSP